MKRVLVTGGGGFIGLALTRALLAKGIEVVVLGRHHYPAVRRAGATGIIGDIRDLQTVKKAVSGCDTVFHVAARAGIWGPFNDYYSINVLGTLNVLAACKAGSVPNLVYTSTPSVVFDGKSLKGVDESVPYARTPLCHYVTTKILAEKAVLRASDDSFQTAALRPHLVWGPGDTNLIPRLMTRGRSGDLRIVGNGENLVDIAYIDNVVHAHLLAAENLETSGTAAGKAFFIGQIAPVNLWKWINDVFTRLGVPPVQKTVSLRKARFAGRMMEMFHSLTCNSKEPKMTRFLAEQLALSHYFSIKRAEEILHYSEQVSTTKGLDRMVAWLKQSNF